MSIDKKAWTYEASKLLSTLVVGAIVCHQSYGGAKTWGRYVGIEKRWDSFTRQYHDFYRIENSYYKCYYDKHLTGRCESITFIPVDSWTMTYPIRSY